MDSCSDDHNDYLFYGRLTVTRTLPYFAYMKPKFLLLSCVCAAGMLLATSVSASICNMKTGCRTPKKDKPPVQQLQYITKHSSSSSRSASVKLPSSSQQAVDLPAGFLTTITTNKKLGIFPSGIYYKEVSNTSQQSTLASIHNSLLTRIVMPPGVFDIHKDQMVIADNMHAINIYKPDGQTRSVMFKASISLAEFHCPQMGNESQSKRAKVQHHRSMI